MVAMRSALFALLLTCAALPRAGAAVVGQAKNRPVSKVITLLKDMVTQLEKEAEEDEETYEKFGCWCTTNDKEKTKSIADGEDRISSLNSAIAELTADSMQLNTEIKNLNTEVEKNQKALATATALRKNQLDEFNQDEKDMLLSINSLKSATNVMAKQNNPQLLQVPKADRLRAVAAVQSQLSKHADLLKGIITPKQRNLLESFIEQPDGFFDSEPTLRQTYEPQSGQVFGILSQMKETFETNLANAQKQEAENQHAYEDLKAAKTSEIAAGQSQIDIKTSELADVDEKNAQSKQDLEDTQSTLTADTEFLADLKKRCAAMDAEYQERTKTRQLEIQAVSKALEFLSSDEAHDLFTNTFNPALLLQRGARAARMSDREAKIVDLLKKTATTHQDPRLSAIALKLRLDKFTKVKESIQLMIDKLAKEKQDDINHKDFCVEQLNENEGKLLNEDRTKQELLAKISDLASTMDDLGKAIEMLKAEIAEAQVNLKGAGETREKMNREFQSVVADQRATQKLLMAALNVLKGFYEKAALVQAKSGGKAPAGPPPPPSFKSYENNAASGGVMGMMQQIIDDAKAMEDEATKAEEESQQAYENFVKDTNNAIEEKTKDMINKSQQRAKAEAEKVETEVNRDESLASLEQLYQQNADLHRSCDFLLKNFELRAQSRDEEMDALKQGISMFSGATFTNLMQAW